MANFTNLTVFVPAFNESKTIEVAIRKILLVLPGAHVVVIDDGSTDGTYERLQKVSSSDLRIIRLQNNRGKGGALRAGVESGPVTTSFFGFLDADLDLDPKGLITGLKLLEAEPSLVGAFGSKIHPESQVRYAWYRKILSWAFRLLLRFLFSVSVSDTQTGLKVFRSEEALLSVSQVKSAGWVFDLELLLILDSQGKQVADIPVALSYQFDSSIRPGSAIAAIRDVLGLWHSRRK